MMTIFAFFNCIIAASGGLIFGYAIGISGGLTSMDSFLVKFFPSVYNMQKVDVSSNHYCKFNRQLLTLFTSSLYLAGLVASFVASYVTRASGRKWSMFVGGITFLTGAIISGVAVDVPMLIIGRIFLGIGVGFANQSVPLYLSEMAPHRVRGTLNICFQLMITIGIFCANLINYSTNKIKGGSGWRISLGLASVPALIITLGSLFLPETPSSLIACGKDEEARIMLIKIRGTGDIDEEYGDLVVVGGESRAVRHPWRNILQRKYRAPVTMAILIPFFQQLTGINVIMFYAPVLFKSIGFGEKASLISAVITGGINILATVVSIIIVDTTGRKVLFLQGGALMLFCQVVVGSLIYEVFGITGRGTLTETYAYFIVIFVCLFVAGFAWSWGPLGWLVPSEIFPLEVRPAGQSINVSVNMFFTFIIGQAFLTMLCHLKFGLFFFFAGWVIIMTTFIYFFFPETKSVPIDKMVLVWKEHWFWGKFISDNDILVGRNHV